MPVNLINSPQGLTADDFYVQPIAPPDFIVAARTGVMGIVGTASWGPVNLPQFAGSLSQLYANVGPITAAALSDPADIASDGFLAFGQGGSDISLSAWSIRVTDTTDLPAALPLPSVGGVQQNGTVQALYTGTIGNLISIVISAGIRPGFYNVSVNPPSSIGVTETFQNIPHPSFWKNLQVALANGISQQRPASKYVRLVNVSPAANPQPPSTGTYTMLGGTDGRAGVTTGMLVGSQAGYPYTGFSALPPLDPPVDCAWIAGLTDESAAPTMEAIAASSGIFTAFPLPSGTSTVNALSEVAGYGIGDPSVSWCKDNVYWFDAANNQQRFSLPTPVIMGRIAAMGPEQSPSNKQVNLVIGTERNQPGAGNQPYTEPEIGLLTSAGILFITNPIPAGKVFGIRHGLSTSPVAVTQPVEYWRMTSFLSRSASNTMGLFVGKLQSSRPDDPLRRAFKTMSRSFFQQLLGNQQIDSADAFCELGGASSLPGLGVNTPDSIAQHFMYALWRVRYLSSVRFFILALEGGTTVVTVATQASVPAQ